MYIFMYDEKLKTDEVLGEFSLPLFCIGLGSYSLLLYLKDKGYMGIV